MAAHTYVTKGYSTYTDIPSQHGGYDHGPRKPVNRYVIETTKIEQFHTPATGYTNHVGSPSKIELLKEYVHAPSMSTEPKYAPKDHYEGYEPNYRLDHENSSSPRYYGREDLKDNFLNKVQIEASRPIKTSNFSSPNKYRHSSPVHSHASDEEAHLIKSGSFSGPNKYHPSSPGSEGARHAKTGNFSGQTNSWQSAGPPVTRNPLTTSTNDINEALSFLEDSVNYLPHSGPRRRGVLDGWSTRAQPIEPERRYIRPTFAGATIQPHYKNATSGSAIDSKEATRKFGGTRLP